MKNISHTNVFQLFQGWPRKQLGLLAWIFCLLLLVPASLRAAQGDPIPGVDVSLEQVPGNITVQFNNNVLFNGLVGNAIGVQGTNALYGAVTNASVQLTAGTVPGNQMVILQANGTNDFSGLAYTTLGAATVNVASNQMVVGNLGSSGQDGIMISNPCPDGCPFTLNLQPVDLSGVGAQMTMATVGQVGGLSGVTAGSLSLSNNALGQLRLRSDFSGVGATQVVVTVYSNDTVVGSTVMADGNLGDLSPTNGTPTQSYEVAIQPGMNIIANQLDHGSNTLDQIMPVVPDGSVVYKYNNVSSNWTAAGYNASMGRWVPDNITLNPGEGAFLQSPSSTTLTFTGTPHVPVLPVAIPSGATYLLSRQTNDIGNYTNIVGTAPTAGTRLWQWNNSNQTYTVYTYGLTGWAPSEPTVATGEAVWISPSGGAGPMPIGTRPLILSGPKTQVVPVGSNATFSAEVAGLQPISLQWFQNNQPIKSATGTVFNIASVSWTNTGYYTLVASNSYGVTTTTPSLMRVDEIIQPGGNGNGNNPTPMDFGDLPSTNWTCWQTNTAAGLGSYLTESIPQVIYPTTLALNGARHGPSVGQGGQDLIWLGTDVSSTSDGVPNANAKGDPAINYYGGSAFSASAILHEENGIRIIPCPFSAVNLNQNLQVNPHLRMPSNVTDPRFTSQGKKGNNLFGSPANLFVPISESPDGMQHRQCYAPGQTVWFTVEAYNADPGDNYGVSYLNVWIDYGDDTGNPDVGNVDGTPDGKFQPDEYVIVDQPIWSSAMLKALAGFCENYPPMTTNIDGYGIDSEGNSALVDVENEGTYGNSLPDIGIQPFASIGLQVVSFTIPNMSLSSCKTVFARFRISKKPLDLFTNYSVSDGESHVHDACSWAPGSINGSDPYNLTNRFINSNNQPEPDPSLGEVNDGGEVEDYPVYITASCSSGIFGTSGLCVQVMTMTASLTTSWSIGPGGEFVPGPTPHLVDVSGTDPGSPCGFNPGPYPLLTPDQCPFEVQVGNSGPNDLSGVTVSYPIPTNAAVQSAAVSQGTWTNIGSTISFNLGDLEVGQTAQIGINFQPISSGLVVHQFNLAADQPLLGATNYEVTNDVTINPVLSIISAPNHTVMLNWPTNGGPTLQQSTNLAAGWTNAPSQTSPYTLTPNQPQSFYRLTH